MEMFVLEIPMWLIYLAAFMVGFPLLITVLIFAWVGYATMKDTNRP